VARPEKKLKYDVALCHTDYWWEQKCFMANAGIGENWHKPVLLTLIDPRVWEIFMAIMVGAVWSGK